MSGVSVKFQDGQASGLAVVVAFAALSLIALDLVWLRVLYVGIHQLLGRGSLQKLQRERHIFHSQLGAYMASLLISNLLSSVSYVMNAAWISAGHISADSFCAAQGALSQVADVATAFFTGAIAVHTFNSLVLHRRLPYWFCATAVVFGWAAAVLLAILPSHFEANHGSFYTIDGALCGISPRYPVWETVIHLVPIFVASLIASAFYALVFLIIRGTIVIKGGLKFNLDPEARRTTLFGTFESPEFIGAVAWSMLWYPFAYIALMFPHLIVCWMSVSGIKVTFGARVATAACSALLGLANVLIFYNTIRVMGPAFSGPADDIRSVHSDKSFVAGKEKENSPVNLRPPAAAFTRPVKAFPPPRSASIVSSNSSNNSTRALLAARYKNAYTASMASTSTFSRPITPVSELNEMVSTPPPIAPGTREKSLFHLPVANVENSGALPAPRRDERSAIHRQSSAPNMRSASTDGGMMTAVPLKTPAVPSFHGNDDGSQRDSFINMYASRSPAGAPGPSSLGLGNRTRPVPPTLVLNDGEPTALPSSGYSSTSSASDAPASAFADRQHLASARRTSFRSQLRERTVDDVPESGLSPLAWASLVTDAATSNGGSRSASAALKASRRRSRSMDNLMVPSQLRPRVPMSATLRREFSAPSMKQTSAQPKSAGLPSRYQNRLARMDSKATLNQGPLSRTPTYKTSSDQ